MRENPHENASVAPEENVPSPEQVLREMFEAAKESVDAKGYDSTGSARYNRHRRKDVATNAAMNVVRSYELVGVPAESEGYEDLQGEVVNRFFDVVEQADGAGGRTLSDVLDEEVEK